MDFLQEFTIIFVSFQVLPNRMHSEYSNRGPIHFLSRLFFDTQEALRTCDGLGGIISPSDQTKEDLCQRLPFNCMYGATRFRQFHEECGCEAMMGSFGLVVLWPTDQRVRTTLGPCEEAFRFHRWTDSRLLGSLLERFLSTICPPLCVSTPQWFLITLHDDPLVASSRKTVVQRLRKDQNDSKSTDSGGHEQRVALIIRSDHRRTR